MKPFFLILVMVVLSCSKTEITTYDSEGVATKLPPIWKTSITDDNNLIFVTLNTAIIDNKNNVIVGGGTGAWEGERKRKLMSLDIATGKPNWEWDDRLTLLRNPTYKDPLYISTDTHVKRDNYLFFPYASSSYCIDLDNGKTAWKHKTLLDRFDWCGGIDDKYFTSGAVYNSLSEESIYEGNVSAGTQEKIVVTPLYTKENLELNTTKNGSIKRIIPFTKNGDILLCILYIDPELKGLTYRTLMGLYDYTKGMWVYERQVLNQPNKFSNITSAALIGNKVYHSSDRSIHCNNVLSGEPVWERSFDQGFGSSGFIVNNGKLYAACEDRFLYCLDINTGQILWKEQNTGTCSPISYLNGVLYYLGGGDGKLHAVDADTGKHLWRVKSPDESVNSGAYFYGLCAAVPAKNSAKGTIVATTGLNAYGYEAVE
jgi:outer membrane protein assembly factor BamB